MGSYLHKTRGADVERGTRTDATWHARPRGSAARPHTRRWLGHVARPRESTRTPGWRHAAVWEACEWWAHGSVGPCNSIGAVTQRRYFAPSFILVYPFIFLRVGLCPLNLKFAGHVDASRALDVSASNEARRPCGLESTRSSLEACALNRVLDHVSETSDAWD